jgi:hypothetical protein
MKQIIVKEFRLTRPAMYDSPGCGGHNDPRQRQGYYVDGKDLVDAIVKFRTNHQIPLTEPVEGEFWKEYVKTVR